MKKCYEYIDELQGMQLFDGIGQTEMKAMLQCLGAQTKEYKKNEYLYRNEDSIDTVGIIVKGKVQLAEYLCADRSALTRELNKMKEEGLLDYDKNSFHILKSLE